MPGWCPWAGPSPIGAIRPTMSARRMPRARQARPLGRHVHAAGGMAACPGQLSTFHRFRAEERLPHQGEHQQQGRADLSPARRRLLRADPDRSAQGRADVLLRGGGEGGRLAPFETLTGCMTQVSEISGSRERPEQVVMNWLDLPLHEARKLAARDRRADIAEGALLLRFLRRRD